MTKKITSLGSSALNLPLRLLLLSFLVNAMAQQANNTTLSENKNSNLRNYHGPDPAWMLLIMGFFFGPPMIVAGCMIGIDLYESIRTVFNPPPEEEVLDEPPRQAEDYNLLVPGGLRMRLHGVDLPPVILNNRPPHNPPVEEVREIEGHYELPELPPARVATEGYPHQRVNPTYMMNEVANPNRLFNRPVENNRRDEDNVVARRNLSQ